MQALTGMDGWIHVFYDLEISNENARIVKVNGFQVLNRGYVILLEYIYSGDQLNFIWVDRPVTITGTSRSPWGSNLDLSLNTGWNVVGRHFDRNIFMGNPRHLRLTINFW